MRAFSFTASNNHISNSGYSYDAAGNQLNDAFSHYEYDAEGRVKHSYSTGGWRIYKVIGSVKHKSSLTGGVDIDF